MDMHNVLKHFHTLLTMGLAIPILNHLPLHSSLAFSMLNIEHYVPDYVCNHGGVKGMELKTDTFTI